MPAAFLGHGSPMNAIERNRYTEAWRAFGAAVPRPRAILAMSAHWYINASAVTAMAAPKTIHDFYGFPEPLYQLSYHPPGAPALADRVGELLQKAEMAPAIDPARGLDHGAWWPLRSIYPKADVPVTQLAIQPRRDAAWHFRLGEALAPLRDENVLILASGGAVHNLRDLDRGNGATPAWARAFDDWLARTVEAGDTETLLDWETTAPEARRAHPTEDHLLPIFVAMGAAGRGVRGRRIHEAFSLGSLSLAAFRFD
ncbi:MAG TPA: 4,5-DOPA dioxygenase extradiol, partial [Stellaceae bacterium]|nr:4,5-DOPA dioxygenase extradiol [Stellaceae bacterium]